MKAIEFEQLKYYAFGPCFFPALIGHSCFNPKEIFSQSGRFIPAFTQDFTRHSQFIILKYAHNSISNPVTIL